MTSALNAGTPSQPWISALNISSKCLTWAQSHLQCPRPNFFEGEGHLKIFPRSSHQTLQAGGASENPEWMRMSWSVFSAPTPISEAFLSQEGCNPHASLTMCHRSGLSLLPKFSGLFPKENQEEINGCEVVSNHVSAEPGAAALLVPSSGLSIPPLSSRLPQHVGSDPRWYPDLGLAPFHQKARLLTCPFEFQGEKRVSSPFPSP